MDEPPFPVKFALKVTNHPFEHNDFDQYPLIAPQPWKTAKKVKLDARQFRSENI